MPDPSPLRGALVMAYGTPERPEDLEAYYTDIRRGRPPAPEQLADLRRRYDAIGGLSPLAERTRAQAAGLQRLLGDGWRVELGLKHAPPFIEDGVKALLEAGVSSITALVLAPHYSALSVGQYIERVEDAVGSAVPVSSVRSWHTELALIDLLSDRVRAARATSLSGCERIELLVSAHSLPVRVLELDNPTYPAQLQATGALVAEAAGFDEDQWRIAWQSAGRTPEPWLGPDLLEVLRSLPQQGIDGVVVCPAGFTSDHLEVLYDVDIEARAIAKECGLRLARTESLNDDPFFLGLLADLLRRG